VRRDLAVGLAVILVGIAGFYLAGGRITRALIDNPENLPVSPTLTAVVLAAVAAFLVNRWLEHKEKS
jgi:hypothetical protein